MKKVITLFIVMVLMLIGCSNDDTENTEQNNNIETETETETPGQLSPLTGIETDDGIDRRPVAVMVNNHSKARPQSGLSQADIVFEILAEGNITRFLAIYQSDYPDVVGPVRSAREYYFDLAERYDALYVYHGAAKFVNAMINERNIEYINGALHDNDGIVFKRESFRKAPHNSYFQFDSIDDLAATKNYEMTADIDPLPFLDADVDIDGEPADQVQINYSANAVVTYNYDEANENYLRSSDGEPTVELDSEERITAENVFIIEAPHKVFDDEGRREIDLESGGKGLLIQKGNVQHVDWKSEDGRIIPVNDGKEVGFVPGQTWINVVPTAPGLEQSVNISSQQ